MRRLVHRIKGVLISHCQIQAVAPSYIKITSLLLDSVLILLEVRQLREQNSCLSNATFDG